MLHMLPSWSDTSEYVQSHSMSRGAGVLSSSRTKRWVLESRLFFQQGLSANENCAYVCVVVSSNNRLASAIHYPMQLLLSKMQV